VNPKIEQRPALVQYVHIALQHTLSREEVVELRKDERERKMAMPIRWLCTSRDVRGREKPKLTDIFVVAKGE
jgi:hypothetical protein